jgi:Na+/H+ antiporter NhaD/arsenite permease-like protein
MQALLEPTAENFDAGMSAVVIGLFALLTVVTVADIILEWRGLQPIGLRIQLWSRANPVVAALLIGAIGALLAHFFGNDIKFATAPNS